MEFNIDYCFPNFKDNILREIDRGNFLNRTNREEVMIDLFTLFGNFQDIGVGHTQ